MFNWYHERTKNKVVFVKKIGDFYKVAGAKYCDIKSSSIKIKVDKKPQTFNLTGSDLFNVHGKRLYIIDMDTQKNLIFEKSKQQGILTTKELDGFVGAGFIGGILSALDEKKYDIFSLIIGIALGLFGGLFAGRLF